MFDRVPFRLRVLAFAIGAAVSAIGTIIGLPPFISGSLSASAFWIVVIEGGAGR